MGEEGHPATQTRALSQSTDSSDRGRQVETSFRIGDPNQTVSGDSATYVLTYDVTGAMRSFNGYDELYWDATGFNSPAEIQDLSVTTQVPGGAQQATCYVGKASTSSTQPCDSARVESGKAVFAQSSIPVGSGVTIDVREGEILALLGPNGAGKTTSINMIRGDLKPDGGRIFLQGVDVFKNTSLAKQRLGVCPQFDALDKLTVREQLSFYAHCKGVRDVTADVDFVMAKVGITDHSTQ